MKTYRSTILAVLCINGFGPVSAQEIDPMTAAGLINTFNETGQWARLTVGTHEFLFDNKFINVDVIYQQDELHLLELSNGQDWCGFAYTWLHTEGGLPQLSEEFGTCLEAEHIASDAGTVSISMWSGEFPTHLVDFVYDGTALEMIRSVNDRSFWVGRHPSDAFLDVHLRQTLDGLLGNDLDYVWGVFDGSSTVQFFDPREEQTAGTEWLVATAIESADVQLEGKARALLALHRIDGRIVAAWQRSRGEAIEVRGDPDAWLMDIIQSDARIP